MTTPLDIESIRKDFPILERRINGARLVYLDSASSSQRPRQVLDAMDDYFMTSHANVHRGAYTLSAEADAAYEGARQAVARLIGAPSPTEVVFTKNATESLNLVARSLAGSRFGPSDVVVLTEMEHHSNIVPWQMMSAERGFTIRFIPLTDDGHLDLSNLDALLDGASLISLTSASNVLGTVPDIAAIAARAHAVGALVCVDACQSVPHLATDVVAMGADFIAFSAHKMVGPTGIGVLWGKAEHLNTMPPFLGGGSMITDVRLDGFDPAQIPQKFEAGTPPIAEAIGLGAAIDYLSALGFEAIEQHEQRLTEYALELFADRFGDDVTMFGPRTAAGRTGLMSFVYKDVHPHDLAQVLDSHGVCVRAGHHCAKPLMRQLGVNATARASWYIYNDTDDIDALADAIAASGELFAS